MLTHPSTLSDTELVARCLEGDARAWEVLVRRYRRLVWAVALGQGLSEADGEDVFQSTWLRVHEALGSLRSVEGLAGWIAAVARSQCGRLTRRRDLERRTAPLLEERARMAEAPAGEAEAFQSVGAAVDRLAARCRDLLRMLYWERASYAAVTRRLRVPQGSIGPTRARCLEKLRSLMEEDRP
jgi:RNA polymerase sigma factor (sigma-70 family)